MQQRRTRRRTMAADVATEAAEVAKERLAKSTTKKPKRSAREQVEAEVLLDGVETPEKPKDKNKNKSTTTRKSKKPVEEAEEQEEEPEMMIMDDVEALEKAKKKHSENHNAKTSSGKKRKRQARDEESGDEEKKGELMHVHRCRFLDWVPLPIFTLTTSPCGHRLALSRRNGGIEVWLVQDNAWHQQLYIPGGEPESDDDMTNSVLTLTWVGNKSTGSRLFGADLEGTIFEVDLHTEKRVADTSSFGGPVWSIDANSATRQVAVGCEDGRVRLFDVLPGSGSGLEYLRTLKSVCNGRILALKWHPDQVQENTLYTGGIDGFIRKWDVPSGQVLVEIATESYGNSGTVCIWSLAVLRDSTVFSGDSEGHIHVWKTDDNSGTLLARFHEHRADVTALVASADEQAVFGSGIDSRVARFQLTPPNEETNSPGKWVYTYSHRPHSQDVRGLAIVEGGKTLVSGGNDTQLVHYPVANFSKARPTKVSPFLHRKLVSISQNAELMLVQHTFHLELWKPKLQKQVLQMRFNERHGIRCSSLSTDGDFIACADELGLKVFNINVSQDNEDDQNVNVKKLLFCQPRDQLPEGALVVACNFSPSGQLLAVGLDTGVVVILGITKRGKSFKLRRICSLQQLRRARERVLNTQRKRDLAFGKKKHNVQRKEEKDDDDNEEEGDDDMVKETKKTDAEEAGTEEPTIGGGAITKLCFSADAQWLACGDDTGTILVFSVDTQQLQSEIAPATLGGCVFTHFAFQPVTHSTNLVISTVANKFFVYNVEKNQVGEWSKKYTDRIDPVLLSQNDCILGITFNPSKPDVAVFWGRSFICKVDFGAKPHDLEDHEVGFIKFKLLTKYRPIVHAEMISENELMLVEAPWLKVMRTFDESLFRKRYGAGT